MTAMRKSEIHHEIVDVTGPRPRILMVVANPTVATTTGWPVGVWAAELFHPLYEFNKVRYDVTVASPDGGKVEIDALSDPRDQSRWSADDLISMGALNTPEYAAVIEDTPKLSALDLDAFDALLICGGQAPEFQFRKHVQLQDAIRRFYEAGKPTAALCHGTCALLDIKLSDGSYLITGKTMTGFANVEEDFSDEAAGQKVLPYRIEDIALERGANYVQAGLFKAFAIRDGNLITGQQHYSAAATAQKIIEALGV